MKRKGTVFLVGAGPGDPGLLTLRGAELLGRADVVVYDALVNPDLLRLAPKSAELINAGKRANQHALPQDQINALLIAKAREGKCVVRLKGGDPYIFGRGGEEAQALAAARIPFEVVPGVSSFVAGPNYAGIPITHRDYSSCFTVFTGHEDPDKPDSGLDYDVLARSPGTKVILMGAERIGEIAEALLSRGMPGDTPVCMVRWATTGRQQTLEATLGTIAAEAAARQFGAPAVVVIGQVVKLRRHLNWFEHRPLFGQRIVVTRARDQASQLTQPLAELGADVLEIPTIRIEPPDDCQPMLEAIEGLGEYDWIIFTSPNGVTAFFDCLMKAFQDVRALGFIRLAAVGPATAAKLRELHLRVDAMPDEFLTSKVARALAAQESLENRRILLARAQVANPELCKALEDLGAIVDDIAFYKTVPETEDFNGAAARLLESGADWITFTSSSTVQNFHARFNLPALVQRFPGIKLASIGPETTRAIAALGLTATVEAKEHTIPGLIRALRTGVAAAARAS